VYFHFIQVLLVKGRGHQDLSGLRDESFPLYRGIDPVANFHFTIGPIQMGIPNGAHQPVLVPDACLQPLVVGKLEQCLLHVCFGLFERAFIGCPGHPFPQIGTIAFYQCKILLGLALFMQAELCLLVYVEMKNR
jgi:hypothetical protein